MSVLKRFLPLLSARPVPSEPPTVEEARIALGGRRSAPTEGPISEGNGVTFSDARGRTVRGVVVCATEADIDVWIDDGRFQRLPATRLGPTPLSSDDPLAAVAADARAFSALHEGERVRFLRRDGSLGEGVLTEKCRYGGLVVHDGRVLAVSFRRIWPLADGAG
ncbi:MAG: hypothetical protein OHK0013_33000 [Sandaracinaceae bacterium]